VRHDVFIAGISIAVSLTLAYLLFRWRGTGTAARPTRHEEAADAVRWPVVFRYSSWGVVIADAGGTRIIAANPAFEHMHGYDPGEMVGMVLADTLAPDARAAFEEQATLLPADDHVVYETSQCRRDGSEFPVLVDNITVRDDAGTIQYRIGTYLDLTQRRATEAARDLAEAQFRVVQDASPDSCMLIDLILDDSGAMTDGCIVYANAPACRLIGQPDGSLSGRLVSDAFPSAADRYDVYADVYRTGETRSLTVHRTELAKWFRVVIVKVGDGVCIISSDTTEQKAAETVLRRSHDELEELVAERTVELESAREAAEAGSRAKSEFLSRASHELRTPLNSVIGFSGILLKNRGGNLGAAELGFLERISHNGRHLLALVNDLLDLSKIEAGKINLELSSVSLYDLVHDVRSTLESRAADRGLALSVDLLDGGPPSPLTIAADEQRLRQVLINLVGNAIKYTERGTVVIRVVTGERGRPLRIEVVDTGPGIPQDRIERMFEPFVIGEVPAAGGESTGLGLAISRSLCTAMGYRLSAASVVGQGSTFTIHLGADRTSGAWGPLRRPGSGPPRHPTPAAGVALGNGS
jgi:two-component system sensor histidine kinase/response regulator